MKSRPRDAPRAAPRQEDQEPAADDRAGARQSLQRRLGHLRAAGAAASSACASFDDYSLEDLTRYIDWMPFFNAWEFGGKFPDILTDPIVGEQASNLYADARRMLKQVIRERWLTARGVIGLFPANSVDDDDVEVYADESRTRVLTRLHFLRQQKGKPAGQSHDCAGGLRRAEGFGPSRLHRRVRGDGGHRHRAAPRALRAGARRLLEHHAQGARRSLRRSVRGAPARARAPRVLGLRARGALAPTTS